jgi:hypothetical protein
MGSSTAFSNGIVGSTAGTANPAADLHDTIASAALSPHP